MYFVIDENNQIVSAQIKPKPKSKYIELSGNDANKLEYVFRFVTLNEDGSLPDDYYYDALINRHIFDLNGLYESKTKELHANADKAGEAYLNRYSEIEKETFGTQKDEAKAWQSDNSAATPFIDSLAQKRGIDRITMIQKVIDAMQALQDISMAIVSEQQAKEDQIKAAYNLKDNYTDPSNQLAEIQHAIETLEALDVSITPVA